MFTGVLSRPLLMFAITRVCPRLTVLRSTSYWSTKTESQRALQRRTRRRKLWSTPRPPSQGSRESHTDVVFTTWYTLLREPGHLVGPLTPCPAMTSHLRSRVPLAGRLFDGQCREKQKMWVFTRGTSLLLRKTQVLADSLLRPF